MESLLLKPCAAEEKWFVVPWKASESDVHAQPLPKSATAGTLERIETTHRSRPAAGERPRVSLEDGTVEVGDGDVASVESRFVDVVDDLGPDQPLGGVVRLARFPRTPGLLARSARPAAVDVRRE